MTRRKWTRRTRRTVGGCGGASHGSRNCSGSVHDIMVWVVSAVEVTAPAKVEVPVVVLKLVILCTVSTQTRDNQSPTANVPPSDYPAQLPPEQTLDLSNQLMCRHAHQLIRSCHNMYHIF